jgi:hypothetical protein
MDNRGLSWDVCFLLFLFLVLKVSALDQVFPCRIPLVFNPVELTKASRSFSTGIGCRSRRPLALCQVGTALRASLDA